MKSIYPSNYQVGSQDHKYSDANPCSLQARTGYAASAYPTHGIICLFTAGSHTPSKAPSQCPVLLHSLLSKVRYLQLRNLHPRLPGLARRCCALAEPNPYKFGVSRVQPGRSPHSFPSIFFPTTANALIEVLHYSALIILYLERLRFAGVVKPPCVTEPIMIYFTILRN